MMLGSWVPSCLCISRTVIEAQQMYTEAEKIFGPDADTVLESYQPGQNPRQFLDGFQNAYIAGKLGDKAALENSTAAAYLTEEQLSIAFELGRNMVVHNAGNRKMVVDEQNSLMYNGDQSSIGEFSLRFLSTRDALYVNSENISPLMGYEDVVCHADPFSVGFVDPVTGETVQEMDAKMFAKMIKESGKYKGGPIRLIACEAGKCADGFAQKLADELGVPILAPQAPVFVDSQGKMVVAESRIQAIERFRQLFGDWNEEGWTLFKPKEY